MMLRWALIALLGLRPLFAAEEKNPIVPACGEALRSVSLLDFGRGSARRGQGQQTAASRSPSPTRSSPLPESGNDHGSKEESPGAPKSRRTLPHPKDDYHVRDMPFTESDETRFLFASTDVDTGHWKSRHYRDIDPFQNRWSNPSSDPVLVPQSIEKPDAFTRLVDLETLDFGSLLLPDGYRPLAPSPSEGQLYVDSSGNYFFRPKHANPILPVKKIGPETLTYDEERDYTRIDAISETSWPDWTRRLLRHLQRGKERGLSEWDLARLVSKQFSRHADYANTPSQGRSVVDQAHCRTFQCSGGTSLATTVLRSVGAPTRPVMGYPATAGESEGGSTLYLPATGHAWIEVYNRASRTWAPFEVTPPGQRESASRQAGDETTGQTIQGKSSPAVAAQVDELAKRWRRLLEGAVAGRTDLSPDAARVEEWLERHPELTGHVMGAEIQAAHGKLGQSKDSEQKFPSLPKLAKLLNSGFHHPDDYFDLRRAAAFFEGTLESLARLRPLDARESQLHRNFVELQSQLARIPTVRPTEAEVGRSFYQNLPGSHSQLYVREAAGLTARGEPDWEKIGQKVKSKEWTPIVKMVRAMGLVRLALPPSEDASAGNRLLGKYDDVRTEGPLRSQTAESPDELALVNTDAIPPDQILFHLLSGNLEYPRFRQEKRSASADQRVTRTHTAVLEDYSGSMEPKSAG